MIRIVSDAVRFKCNGVVMDRLWRLTCSTCKRTAIMRKLSLSSDSDAANDNDGLDSKHPERIVEDVVDLADLFRFTEY